MKTKYYYINVFAVMCVILNFECTFLEKLPQEIPDDTYLIYYDEFTSTDEYSYLRYINFDGMYFYFIDSSNDILAFDSRTLINKYNTISGNDNIRNSFIVDMSKYRDEYIITTRDNNITYNSLKIIISSDFVNYKIVQVDLPNDITLLKGLKYYENGNYFIGIQKNEINGENYGKLLKFNYDLTNDKIILDNDYPEILLKDITYFNIFNDSLLYYRFIDSETRSDTRNNFGPQVVYNKYEISDFNLINLINYNNIEYFRKDDKIIDILFYDQKSIYLFLDTLGSLYLKNYESWW